MEWIYLSKGRKPENYVVLGEIISKFMSIMNDGMVSGVFFHPNVEKLLYMENDEYKKLRI